MAVVEVIGLHKKYGKIHALRGVSLAVEEKQIFGFLGQNGAGKTTMVKILLDMVRGTEGEARLLGRSSRETGVRREVGYLPEGHTFPEYHTAASVLDFYGSLYAMPRADRRARIDECLDVVGLGEWKRTKIRKFSKGMKQRLGIAHAIFHRPRVLILDEPTDGIDPLGRRQIRDLMVRLRDEGATVFLNSHLLGEVEQICDRVAILDRGHLVREGTIAELTKTDSAVKIRVATDPAKFFDGFKQAFPSAIRLDDDLIEVALREEREIDRIVDWLRGHDVSIRGLEAKRLTLEEVFVGLVKS
jgi:ABC-2 type transport system ATP-binding protein